MTDEPILRFKSHIGGKNADVHVYADRIEWGLAGAVSSGKLAAGILTGGLSAKATGGLRKKQRGSEVIPVRSISSVTTEKDGLRFTKVKVITTGNTIDFRVGHNEATAIKDTLVALMVGNHPAQQTAPAAASPPPSAPPPPPPATSPPAPRSAAASPPAGGDDKISKLRELAQLRDEGILTEEEFAAEKARVLGG